VLTDQQAFRALLAAGVMPEVAEMAISGSNLAEYKLPTDQEIEEHHVVQT
jgi:hypothetical protein